MLRHARRAFSSTPRASPSSEAARGFGYTAKYLLRDSKDVQVTILDRWPTLWTRAWHNRAGPPGGEERAGRLRGRGYGSEDSRTPGMSSSGILLMPIDHAGPIYR